jgi:Spy/CpxP family protein refolding chaperone
MRRVASIAFAGLWFAAAAAVAQSGSSSSQPYAGMQDRRIKALSPEQMDGLRSGRGMAMALPAELNRYPGPMHSLEHADQLGLSSDQRAALERQMRAMRTAAVALGERLIALEAELDALFASGSADDAGIERLTAAIGAAHGQLRAVHLRTHLETRATLTAAQVAEYVRLRGYDAGTPFGAHGGHRPH